MIKQKLIILTSSFVFLFILCGSASAQNTQYNCNQFSNAVSTTLSANISGSVYVRLPEYSSVNKTNVNVYIQPISLQGGNCQKIGNSDALVGSWSKVSDVISAKYGDQIFVAGDNLGAEPYAAVAMVMFVENNACIPASVCETTTSHGEATLDPILISGNTDQVAIYHAVNISDQKAQIYNYFDNGKLLYTSNKYSSFNKNYLSGGKHQLNIQAEYKNFEKLNYYSHVDMGPDWSKWLLIRSTFFKMKTSIKIISLVILAIILLSIGLAFYHFVIIKIKQKHDHNIDNYKGPDEDNKTENNIVIG